jgi:hypothetical protein
MSFVSSVSTESRIRTYNRSAQGDVPTEVDVAGDRKMIKLKNPRNLLESLLELLDLSTPRRGQLQRNEETLRKDESASPS